MPSRYELDEKKGKFGERCFERFLNERNYKYNKAPANKRHLVDYVVKGDKGKFIAEVKTKEPMKDGRTGFNKNYYDDYIATKDFAEMLESPIMGLYFFFIDYKEKCVYGEWLHNLEGKEIVRRHFDKRSEKDQDIVFFHRKLFKRVFDLTEEEASYIASLSQDNG